MIQPRSGLEVELTIEALAAAGDGKASLQGTRILVPLTLAGERWRVRLERRVEGGWLAEPIVCLQAGDRAEPPCPHFGRCGGCRLQHLPDALYTELKVARIASALRARGLAAATMLPFHRSPPHSRRRLRLGLEAKATRLRLGYRQRASHALVPVTACPIARPALERLVVVLGPALATALTPPLTGELALTETAGGSDLLLDLPRLPTLQERERLAALADQLDLARLAWRTAGTAESIVERRAVFVRLGGLPVLFPPGSFLQATAEGEAVLASTAERWAGDGRRVLDLYAGLGTLSLGLARTGRSVHAVELNPAATAALAATARQHRLPLTVESRDLARRPLASTELDRFDLALLDPPRAGAPAQCEALARSRLRHLIYASCEPATFARDAALLTGAGFTLESLLPVDQFLYAPAIELIAYLTRP